MSAHASNTPKEQQQGAQGTTVHRHPTHHTQPTNHRQPATPVARGPCVTTPPQPTTPNPPTLPTHPPTPPEQPNPPRPMPCQRGAFSAPGCGLQLSGRPWPETARSSLPPPSPSAPRSLLPSFHQPSHLSSTRPFTASRGACTWIVQPPFFSYLLASRGPAPHSTLASHFSSPPFPPRLRYILWSAPVSNAVKTYSSI